MNGGFRFTKPGLRDIVLTSDPYTLVNRIQEANDTPDSAMAHLKLVFDLWLLGKWEKARAYLRAMETIFPAQQISREAYELVCNYTDYNISCPEITGFGEMLLRANVIVSTFS